MALYIFSDAHLGSSDVEKEELKTSKMRTLFELVKKDGDRLIILGDLFDFWFEYKHAIPKEHHQVLFMLSDLVNRGIAIDYICGNHDFWMGDFFESQIGLKIHKDFFDLIYQNKKLHLIHGDGLAPADRGYRFLKRVLRNRFNIWLYQKLPPDWAIPLAKTVSGSSREYTGKRDHSFAPDYEAYAQRMLNNGFDIVVIGHLHLPVYTELEKGVYINTGDFINHFSYAKLSDGEINLLYL
ncbi:MAG: UDP-2,3-diacylglucosamine diphosphatase [FCB group bacterium]|nr:UDP-2,3-diacylglucosamine diphosphatase [FCB group bacterium]